jgi:hypothetical protein
MLGLDPGIRGFAGAAGGWVLRVDGRIRSGHDEHWGPWFRATVSWKVDIR